MEKNFKPERNLALEMSPDDVKKILENIITNTHDEQLLEVSEKIARIKTFVLDQFQWDDCAASPYWRALAGSSMKKGITVDLNAPIQKKILAQIIGSIQRLVESLETTVSAAESSSWLIRDIESFREKLSLDPSMTNYFNQEMNQRVRLLQKNYPNETLTEIPEVQYIISGSEVAKHKGVSINTIKEVTESLTIDYLSLKELIEESLSRDYAKHS